MWDLVKAGQQGSWKNVIFCAHVEVWLHVISVFYPFLFFQYELQRISFDKAVSSLEGSKDTPTADVIRNILRKLLFFHSDSKDKERLVKKNDKPNHVTQFVTINVMNCSKSRHI